ncbi:MAG TPA: hypothetical protein VI279_02490 [Rhodocyclaceae bacterium]
MQDETEHKPQQDESPGGRKKSHYILFAVFWAIVIAAIVGMMMIDQYTERQHAGAGNIHDAADQ